MLVTLVILVLSAVFFVSGRVRSDIVALCALIGLLVFHVLTPEEALSGFSNSVVIMMVGTVCRRRGYLPDRIGQDDQFTYFEVGR